MYVKALLPTSETLNRESSLFKNMEAPIMPLAKASSFDYPCGWEWLSPGGLPGLQNLWRVALRAAVGSTPIHSRLFHELFAAIGAACPPARDDTPSGAAFHLEVHPECPFPKMKS